MPHAEKPAKSAVETIDVSQESLIRMSTFLCKFYVLLMTCSSVLHNSQSACPTNNGRSSLCLVLYYGVSIYSANVFTHLDQLTEEVSANLITTTDGVSLHGIRVLWTIKSQYLNCQFESLRVELSPLELGKVITVNDSSAEFLNLDCNRQYRPRVRAVKNKFATEHRGAQLFYGGIAVNHVLCCITYCDI